MISIDRNVYPLVSDGSAVTGVSMDCVIEQRVCNLTDPSSVVDIFKGCDIVIHLAALPKPWESYSNIASTNYPIDYNVINESSRCKVKRFIYASTNHVQHREFMRKTPESLDSSRYGKHISSFQLKTIHDSPDPDSFYAISKLNGENLGRYYAGEFGMEFIALRIGFNYIYI